MKLRVKKNMSQGDLATTHRVDRAYISNIENGRMNPTLSTLETCLSAGRKSLMRFEFPIADF